MKIPLPSHSLSYYVDLFFKEANRIVDILDHSAINTVSAFSPWLSPFAPAVLVYNHLINKLGYSQTTSFVVALVIEFVGISSINIYFRIVQHNKKAKEDRDRISPKGALFAGIFYLSILIIVNVVLEIDTYIGSILGFSVETGITIAHVLAMGLISLLSLPAAILLSSRAAYQDIVNRLITEKQERKEGQELRRKERQYVTASFRQDVSVKIPDNSGKWDWRTLSHADREMIATLTPKQAMEKYPGLDDRTARGWVNRAKKMFQH